MGVRRNDSRDMDTMLSDLFARVRRLEETCSRRTLPPGYEASKNADGDLILRRVSDGAEEVISFP